MRDLPKYANRNQKVALESFDSMVQDKGRDYAERQFDKTLEVIDMAIDKLNFMSNTVNDESAKLVGIKLSKASRCPSSPLSSQSLPLAHNSTSKT